jgi:hypothetical protein
LLNNLIQLNRGAHAPWKVLSMPDAAILAMPLKSMRTGGDDNGWQVVNSTSLSSF